MTRIRIPNSGPEFKGNNVGDVPVWDGEGWEPGPAGGGLCLEAPGVTSGGPPVTTLSYTFALADIIAALPSPTSCLAARLTVALEYDADGVAYGAAVLPLALLFVAGALTTAVLSNGIAGAAQDSFWAGSIGTPIDDVAGTEGTGQWAAVVVNATTLRLDWVPGSAVPMAGRAQLCMGPAFTVTPT